tara:strand:+ start:1508 stop:1693 length:186 start_codon:yes stop_codon:yes gene_type:complete
MLHRVIVRHRWRKGGCIRPSAAHRFGRRRMSPFGRDATSTGKRTHRMRHPLPGESRARFAV